MSDRKDAQEAAECGRLKLSELLNEVKAELSSCSGRSGTEMTPCEIRREAEIIVCRACSLSLTELITGAERSVCESGANLASEWARRRAEGEPWAYITGRRGFYGLEFKVGPGVLIPRPETELLVDSALEELQARLKAAPPGEGRGKALRALDLCTGSGCVALSLKKLVPSAEVWAQDISPETFPYFEANCADLGLVCLTQAAGEGKIPSGAVVWRSGDLFELIEGRFDVITANPPYVGSEGGDGLALQESVKAFEPSLALFGGADGLDVIKRIIARAGKYLRRNGRLLLEIGAGHGQGCGELMRKAGFAEVEIKRDFAGLDRVCSGVFKQDL